MKGVFDGIAAEERQRVAVTYHGVFTDGLARTVNASIPSGSCRGDRTVVSHAGPL